jgi:hypothetical protein
MLKYANLIIVHGESFVYWWKNVWFLVFVVDFWGE